jgi:hypothetical protein
MGPIGLGLNILTSEGVDYRGKPLPAIPETPQSIIYSDTQHQPIYKQQHSAPVEEVEYLIPSSPCTTRTTFISSDGFQHTNTNENILAIQHELEAAYHIIASNAASYKEVVAAYEACRLQLLDLRKENVRLQSILSIQIEVSTL